MRLRLLAFLLTACVAGTASAKVRVVASLPALGAIASEVVGDLGTVEVLAPATQDPHFVDGKPSMMLTLNKADLLIDVGLGLEKGWLPPLVDGARNPKIREGQPGRLNAMALAGTPLGVPATLDRSLGDVHAGGNPHFWYDPRRVREVASGVAERLATIDAENAAAYRANAAAFREALEKEIARWEHDMAPFRGRALVPFHDSLVYLRDWLGLEQQGTVEPLPGIPPSPSHLAQLILEVRKAEPKPLIVTEPWYDRRTARTVAEKGGAALVILPGEAGASAATKTYAAWMEETLSRLHAGWQEKK